VASHRLDLQELLVRVDRAQNIGMANVIDENFHNSDVENEKPLPSPTRSFASVVTAIGV
jgi:hypothetical protein